MTSRSGSPRIYRRSHVQSNAALRGAAIQENYEIQVYGAATVPRGVTMFELHSNYTESGRRVTSAEGELPTNHAIHESGECWPLPNRPVPFDQQTWDGGKASLERHRAAERMRSGGAV